MEQIFWDIFPSVSLIYSNSLDPFNSQRDLLVDLENNSSVSCDII